MARASTALEHFLSPRPMVPAQTIKHWGRCSGWFGWGRLQRWLTSEQGADRPTIAAGSPVITASVVRCSRPASKRAKRPGTEGGRELGLA